MADDIVTGERFQLLCDVWCGFPEDFQFNPVIRARATADKVMDLRSLVTEWANPRLLFCYGHRLESLQERIHLLKNPFVLVTHNSDENIIAKYLQLLESPQLIRMFSQNPCIVHPRLSILPIGVANSMWKHGSVHVVQQIRDAPPPKSELTYFFFNILTNFTERDICKRSLQQKGLVFDRQRPYPDYLTWLARHLFCISPDGNGVDCHRVWECYYCKVIPVLKRSVFTGYLEKIGLPCIVIDNWDDLRIEELTAALYNEHAGRICSEILSLACVAREIQNNNTY